MDWPYSTATAAALCDEGFLIPLRVEPNMHEVEEVADDVLAHLDTPEGQRLLVPTPDSPKSRIYSQKVSKRLMQRYFLHREKLSDEIERILRKGSQKRENSEWIEVDANFGNYYMTLLATRLAERIGSELVTPIPLAEKLSSKARLTPFTIARNYTREYEALSNPRILPASLGTGLLAHIAIQSIKIDPETPVEKLTDFKKNHVDELNNFRLAVSQLTSEITTNLPTESLRQRINDIYASSVVSANNKIQKALTGNKIKWLAESIFRTAYFSLGSKSLIDMGVSTPTALLSGAGASVVVSTINYNLDKEAALRENPYSYLMSIQKELL